ncbi:integrase arm-type DNA-binding domain-containing protein [Shinella yambaruensis]|nr:site-specific integrase [Shinella yambaruensis]MCJ8030071.1 integrase arm-type DNA-binding domain-containing protein [Shinella yambaruensis]MCU7984354.1 integrase arm-type DNA-binding domain-containing protein [Shinella yambaruensis]
MVGRRHKLKALQVAADLAPGRYPDGDGLYLRVTPTRTKSWMFLWKRSGKRYEMGMGRLLDVSLKEARLKADEARAILLRGGNPLTDMEERKVANEMKTFAAVADDFISIMKPSWSNPKHAAQWTMTLGDAYCEKLRKVPVQEIDTEHVLQVLTPHWQSKPETASRIRGRIEKVLDFAKTKGWRSGDNPARWNGHLKNALPTRKRETVKHHKALPYQEVPAFYQLLSDAMAARALQFLILTASRSGEVLGATWQEIDWEAAVWTVPAVRMKDREEHRVPLVPTAIAILKALYEIRSGDFIFFGQAAKKPLSGMAMGMLLRRMKVDVTVHGFRSSFRDWAGDATNFSRDIAEAALAHSVGNKVELAYRRSDALEKRRKMMAAWANYVRKASGNTIISFPEQKKIR